MSNWVHHRAGFFIFSNLSLRITLRDKENFDLFSIDEEIEV